MGLLRLRLPGAALASLAIMRSENSDAEQVDPAVKPLANSKGENSIEMSDIILPPRPDQDEPAFEAIDGPDRMPAETGTIIEEPPTLPAEPQTAPPPAPAGRILKEAAFVVRFNDNPEIKRCLDLFRKDKDAARAEFAEWASKHPALDGLTLHRVNYSGEAILRYTGADDANPVSNAKAMQARLNGLPFVRYADPRFYSLSRQRRVI